MGLVENTLTGNLILTVMLAFAEYERGMIVERTQTGKAVARQNPNFREGRPKKFTAVQIQHAMELLDSGKSYKQVEAMTGISKSTLIRAQKKHKKIPPLLKNAAVGDFFIGKLHFGCLFPALFLTL
jgi:DNA invertase Pin-like site-specific DNA recombinase